MNAAYNIEFVVVRNSIWTFSEWSSHSESFVYKLGFCFVSMTMEIFAHVVS